MTTESQYRSFVEKLKALRKRELAVWSIVRLFRFIVFFGSIVLLISLAESILWLPPRYRLGLFVILTAAGLGLLIFFGLSPVLGILGRERRFSFETLAGNVGSVFPDIRDRLLNTMQLFSQLKNNKEGYSEALVSESMKRSGASFGSYDFNKSIDYRLLRSQAKLLGLFAVTVFGFFLFTAGALNNAALRVFQPTKEFAVPASFSLIVTPGDAEILRNDPMTIAASVRGESPGSLYLYLKRESGSEYEKFDMEPVEPGQFVYDLAKANESFEYFVMGEEKTGVFLTRSIESDRYSVNVVYRPMVRMLKIRLDYPAYSGMGSRYLDDNIGDISALKGTEARISIILNKPVKNAFLSFADGETLPLSVVGLNGEASFTIRDDDRYTVRLSDDNNITNSDPIEYRISPVPDAFPFIQMMIPGEDTDLTEDKQLLVGIKLSDDFGITKLRLGYSLILGTGDSESLFDEKEQDQGGSEKFTYLNLPVKDKRGIVQDNFFFWDLNSIQLFPEDKIIYFAEVFDNDMVSGPKRTRSELYTLRFPSLDELFEQAAEIQDKQTENLSEVVDEGEDLREMLKELSEDFLQTKELEWEQQQKTEEAIKKQEDLQNKMDDIQKEIEKLVEAFEKNDLLSSETLDKYKELQELLKELSIPEMEEAMKNMRESLEKRNEMTQNRQNLENLREQQEDYLERVERMLKMLKRLQVEQMMDEVVIKAEDISESQKIVNDHLDSLTNSVNQEESESEKNKLSKQEKDLAENVDNLKLSMEKLLEKMVEQPDFSPDKLSKALENLDAKELSKKMKELSKSMIREDGKKSLEKGRQIEKEMEEVESELKDAQKEMKQNQRDEILREMRKSASDLLNISVQQEDLKSGSKSLTANSDKFRQTADIQNNLRSGLSKVLFNLSRLSEKSFFITPEIGGSVNKSMNFMQNSIRMLESRNREASITNQDKSLQGLNETIALLRNAINEAQRSGDGVGYEEFLERMEQMSRQQQELNENTQKSESGEGLTPEEQAYMQRLAEDQELIRKSLEQLRKEMQGQADMKEQMAKMGDDMEGIIKDLKDLSVTDRTRKLQQQILSRMLDAQRSIHRRDFSKKRIAELARTYEGIDPGELPSNLGEQGRFLEEDLIKALKEGYTRDFEELVRKYFENLNKQRGVKKIKNN